MQHANTGGKAGILIIDAFDDYSDFRVLTLSGLESTIGTGLKGEAELVELASKIRQLGAWRYRTKNVWPRPRLRLHGHAKLGELNAKLIFDMDARALSLSRAMYGFTASDSGHLKTSALFQPLKQYVTETDLCASGTIFEGM